MLILKFIRNENYFPYNDSFNLMKYLISEKYIDTNNIIERYHTSIFFMFVIPSHIF